MAAPYCRHVILRCYSLPRLFYLKTMLKPLENSKGHYFRATLIQNSGRGRLYATAFHQKASPHRMNDVTLCIMSLFWPAAFTVGALSFGFKDKKEGVPADGGGRAAAWKVSDIVAEADRLYAAHDVSTLYRFLCQFADVAHDEVQWRLARAACDQAKTEAEASRKEALFSQALDHARRALRLNENNFACHKWYAVMLNYLSPFWGVKESLKYAYVIRTHLEKAVELNPKDATSIHSLGYWCFVFADLKWYERKVAALLFSEPPTSTYNEALKYFLMAEDVDPHFYSMNLTMIGKTYLRLNNQKMAMLYLTQAKEYPVITEDDKEAREEAVTLLRQIKVQS